MRTTRTPSYHCPECGYRIDAATSAFGNHKPKEGDLSLCIRCASVFVFNKDLTIRKANLDDLMKLDEQTHREIERAQNAIRVKGVGR